MKRMNNILWGIVLIIIGTIFGLNALEITNINIFFDGWWTLFIIVPCFIDLFTDENKTGNIIGLIIGIFLLLACQDIIDFVIIVKLIVPISLVIIGLSLIFKDAVKSKIKEEIKRLNRKNRNIREYCATFGNQNIEISNEVFNGCELTAVFGSVKCDLKDAIIEENIVIDANAIFGGITIYTPENINIKVVSTPIFGGVSDKRQIKTKDSKLTIYINATCVFGGIEIKWQKHKSLLNI